MKKRSDGRLYIGASQLFLLGCVFAFDFTN
jgi:hypothetical protein